MKKILQLFLLCCVVNVFNCADFLGDFNRIEHNKIRVLDFMYEPAEAVPGDTVQLTAVFAGLPIDMSDIVWSVSYNLGGNGWIVDTAYDIQPLVFTIVDTQFSLNTYTASLKFVVPGDVMMQSSMIPDNWIDMVPEENLKYVPDDMKNMDKNSFLTLIESYKTQPMPEEMSSMMPLILQLLTIKIRLIANVKGSLRVRSDYGVRYNTAFTHLPMVNKNTNPTIQSVGIYKVEGEGLQSFDTAKHEQPYELLHLYGMDEDSVSDTIIIDKGYSYFVIAETGNFDLVSYVDTSGKLVSKNETHFFNWFFLFDESEQEGISQNHLPNVEQALSGKTVLFIPSLNENIIHFVMWANTYDYFLQERLRPEASTLKEVQGVFKYTDEYIEHAKELKKKN